ncbi:hypothetical protein [Nodosilinea sp. E11]|uniref:hypothetical protein n=1 Tax=Nodosilinea sp. E11 TaxID=3037479 RepID=UPI0029348BD1|nr:hypothetical protein [Nodosilinea sp. E11]WOD40346.1 hypothetical protein RRF56_06010 [Nodosilinea sp. E11]
MNTQLVNSIIEVVRALPTEEQTALLETLNSLFQPLGDEGAIEAICANSWLGMTAETAVITNHDLTSQSQDIVLQIDDLRTKLFKSYGEFSDSTDLIREDREEQS